MASRVESLRVRAVTLAALPRESIQFHLGVLSVGLGMVAAAAIGVLVTEPKYVSIVLGLGLIPAAVALCVASPRAAITLLVVWTAGLGLLRRLLESSFGPSSFRNEPLLLIEPLLVVMLFVVARQRGALQERDSLSQSVYWLTILLVAEALNPWQGSIAVGLAGLVLLLPPILLFWVGRSLLSSALLRRLLIMVAFVAVASAVYGLVQQFVGFPSWDKAWIARVSQSSYIGLNVGGVIRAFANFASGQEYATYLGIGVVIWLAAGLQHVRRLLILPTVAILGFALFLESSRGAVVYTVAGIGVMICARAGLRARGALIGGCLALVLLFLAAQSLGGRSIATTPQRGSTTAGLVSHQLAGLANPVDPKTSTLAGHLRDTIRGTEEAFVMPFGHGTGSISEAANKFGGTVAGTESDISNAGAGLGLAGLLLFVAVLLRSLAWTYRLAATRRDFVGLAVLGLVVVCLMQWLNGGLYSTAILVWLCLGWVVREWTDGRGPMHEPIHEGVGHPEWQA
jgi:hypothetical protein